MKYEAIIFDLFGTLVDSVSLQEYQRMLAKIASTLSINPDVFMRLWSETGDERIKGIIKNFRENLEYILRQAGLAVDHIRIEQALKIQIDMIQGGINPRPDAIKVLSSLRSDGYKTGLISDCTYEATVIWENTPFPALFDVVVFSCLVGLRKPNVSIYQMATERLRVNPHNCLYIGDGGSHELTGASQAGMNPILLRIPGEDTTNVVRGSSDEAEEWNGPVITSLIEVLKLVK